MPFRRIVKFIEGWFVRRNKGKFSFEAVNCTRYKRLSLHRCASRTNVVKAHFKQMTVVSASFDAIPRLLLTLVTALMISSFNARFSRFAPASSFVNLAFPLDIRFLIISYSTNSIDFYDKIDVLRKIVAMREREEEGGVSVKSSRLEGIYLHLLLLFFLSLVEKRTILLTKSNINRWWRYKFSS